jgi:CHAT domain-containing protein
VLTGNDANRTSVLTAMRSAPSVHFSCHAQVDPLDPSASKLLLADHQQRPLTVVDVARLRLEDAHLAFLAACSTAQSPRRLTDEAIHLASAFQLAGYRHVIGTLWPVNDVYAAKITRRVYDRLAAGESVANAIHDATLRMLQEPYSRPSAWASHIHAGP